MYEGLVKCSILPPRDLYIPLLPTHINDKLMFVLCRTCTEKNNLDKCTHSKQERALTGVWVTEELKKAMEIGYKVRYIIYVWGGGCACVGVQVCVKIKCYLFLLVQVITIFEVWHYDEITQYDPNGNDKGLMGG